jgi:cell division protein FtsL
MARTARAGAAVAPRPARRQRPRVAAPRAVPRAVRARGESVLDSLLRGRAWIALVGLLLVGIVFFNVDLLRLNRSIAVTSEKSEQVSRDNARLRRELARLGSSERVQKAALQRGLVLPSPGDVRFRDINKRDDRRALANLKQSEHREAAGPAGPTPEPTQPQQTATPTQAVTTPQAPAATPTPPPASPPTPPSPTGRSSSSPTSPAAPPPAR